MKIDYSKLEGAPLTKEAAQRYMEHGIYPGHFLTAVFVNDLTQAITRADEVSLQNLKQIVMWMIWEIPSIAWGSRDAMNTWIDHSGLAGWRELDKKPTVLKEVTA